MQPSVLRWIFTTPVVQCWLLLRSTISQEGLSNDTHGPFPEDDVIPPPLYRGGNRGTGHPCQSKIQAHLGYIKGQNYTISWRLFNWLVLLSAFSSFFKTISVLISHDQCKIHKNFCLHCIMWFSRHLMEEELSQYYPSMQSSSLLTLYFVLNPPYFSLYLHFSCHQTLSSSCLVCLLIWHIRFCVEFSVESFMSNLCLSPWLLMKDGYFSFVDEMMKIQSLSPSSLP